jgi:CheY-specific phosphatase CheX
MSINETVFFSELMTAAQNNISKLGISASAVKQPLEQGSSLDDYTSFIQVSGAIQGGVILTVETELALALAQSYILDPITLEEEKTYAVGVVAELVNVICGNALTERVPHPIFFGNPLIFVSQQAEIRTRSAQTFIQYFNTSKGSFQLMFIPMDQESELSTILQPK